MISAQESSKKSRELSFGFIVSALYSIAVKYIPGIPRMITALPAFHYRWFNLPTLKISFLNSYALGNWIHRRHTIAIPLGIGILAKNLICGPAHLACFTHLPFGDFLVAFAGGMVAYGALISFLTLPSAFKGSKRKQKTNTVTLKQIASLVSIKDRVQWLIFLICTGIFLALFQL